MSDSEFEAPKLTDLHRVITSPAVIQINAAGDKKPALFVNMVTSEGGMTFCFSPEELSRLITQLQGGETAVLHTQSQMEAVDWDSLRRDESGDKT